MAVGATVDNTWGAAFVGLLLAAILYGITCVQTYIYFSKYIQDSWEYKLLAGLAFALDTTSLIMMASAMYGYLITDITNPLGRLFVRRAFDIEPTLMGLLAFITHLYLGRRVWLVCKRNVWLGLLLGSLTLATLALAIASTIVSWKYRTWIQLKQGIRPLALAGIFFTVLTDTLIASVLCIALMRQIREVEGKRTRKLVRRVLIFAVNTGLACSLLSLCNLAIFFALPDTMIFLALTLIYTKVYANALFANLNAREHENRSRPRHCNKGESVSINLSTLSRTHHTTASQQESTTILVIDRDGAGDGSKHAKATLSSKLPPAESNRIVAFDKMPSSRI